MNFHVLTLFPEMVKKGLETSITGRAIEAGQIQIEAVNIRDFSANKHKKVDDYPYGGGAGMLMQAQPVYDCYQSVAAGIAPDRRKRVIYVTPQGLPFTQRMAEEFAASDELIFLCGHYEGIDERVLEEIVTDYVSIGDYVLTGGELAAMVMIDAIARLVPGVLHNEVSAETESFHGYLLEHPQYSRPEEWHRKKVPQVLLGGNQKKIDLWRREASVERTRMRRPDLYEKYQELEMIRRNLMQKKMQHIDMIELITRGRLILLAQGEEEVLLLDPQTGIAYHAGTDCELLLGLSEEKKKKLTAVVLHTPEIFVKAEEVFLPQEVQKGNLYAYTQKEKLSVSGLYRADGRQTEEGFCLRSDDRKQKLCAYLEEKYIGEIEGEKDGSLGLPRLIEEEGEGMRFRKALLTGMVNESLEQGLMPFGYLPEEELTYRTLLEEMKIPIAKKEIEILFLSKA